LVQEQVKQKIGVKAVDLQLATVDWRPFASGSLDEHPANRSRSQR
jgi:hypothetical protein